MGCYLGLVCLLPCVSGICRSYRYSVEFSSSIKSGLIGVLES